MLQPQQHVVNDLSDFEDFMSSAFLQAFLEEDGGFNPLLLRIEPGVPKQPSPEVVSLPAPAGLPSIANSVCQVTPSPSATSMEGAPSSRST
jgi:hypothetical protein